MNEKEKAIVDALKQPMNTKRLYEKVSKIMTDRMFREYVNHLIDSGVIEVVGMEDRLRIVKKKI